MQVGSERRAFPARYGGREHFGSVYWLPNITRNLRRRNGRKGMSRTAILAWPSWCTIYRTRHSIRVVRSSWRFTRDRQTVPGIKYLPRVFDSAPKFGCPFLRVVRHSSLNDKCVTTRICPLPGRLNCEDLVSRTCRWSQITNQFAGVRNCRAFVVAGPPDLYDGAIIQAACVNLLH
ncbi:hypothetical protein CA51_42500 [Rosistilla oblonga]|nr:hypothetical protein CA51_42500 [Rosistilla oblonga]